MVMEIARAALWRKLQPSPRLTIADAIPMLGQGRLMDLAEQSHGCSMAREV